MPEGEKKSFFKHITPELLDRVGPGRRSSVVDERAEDLAAPGATFSHRRAITDETVDVYERDHKCR